MLKGFRDFVLRGNVVDLAVGVVIGAAFGAVVTAFTKAFLDPLIKLITGGAKVGGAFSISGVVFDYGSFLTALITFVLTAAVVYFVVVVPMNAANERLKRSEKPPVAEPSNEEKLLAEIRDALKSR
ncbi:large conductance mechanosensitive channel protein MscL [Deinococcus sp. KNUC1210]|uniref:large conductance mechanosensitive channel protein MscL n=1 Tax=Deinococcus sp. KNUC1210 TaxID=2917691 RepID=UPI001EF0AC49|nr:large conductance mechanosensitive channel protein MscL [Deinococcus sp. KNUC1210]ULH15139.1 large conductance mechanosensitive channel protein MscL [Deinococcus sp. KNUC1210]